MENQHESPSLTELAILLLTGTIYAGALSTPQGRALDDNRKTRYLVTVFGVLLVLGVVAMRRPRHAGELFMMFAAAGIPFSLRSAIETVIGDDRALDTAYNQSAGQNA